MSDPLEHKVSAFSASDLGGVKRPDGLNEGNSFGPGIDCDARRGAHGLPAPPGRVRMPGAPKIILSAPSVSFSS